MTTRTYHQMLQELTQWQGQWQQEPTTRRCKNHHSDNKDLPPDITRTPTVTRTYHQMLQELSQWQQGPTTRCYKNPHSDKDLPPDVTRTTSVNKDLPPDVTRTTTETRTYHQMLSEPPCHHTASWSIGHRQVYTLSMQNAHFMIHWTQTSFYSKYAECSLHVSLDTNKFLP